MLRYSDQKAGGPHPRRLVSLFVCFAVILGMFGIRLFQVQIVDGEEYAKLADDSTKTSISLSASRGEILDCNQIPLVSNATSYEVTLDYNYFPHGTSEEQQKKENDCLLALVKLFDGQGEEWIDTLPITAEEPYAFSENRETGVERLRSNLNMAGYATAENCMAQMVQQFSLESYTAREKRVLAGIRYGMMVAMFSPTAPYTFATDISGETMYKILENSGQYPGVDVGTVAVRQYTSGKTACHIIGSVGPIYAEEYEELSEKGYSFNDVVGKSGIEAAAEDYLRGTAGKRVLSKDSTGTVLSEEKTVEPIPGQTVILSLDSALQKVAQETLDTKIRSLRATAPSGKGREIKSGAAVMLDVKTGGVKVCASWPDYDLSTYSTDYEELVNNADNPLFNRALYGTFPCGSTFKPGMALAAITEGVITSSSTIQCNHVYTYYAPGYTPKCLGRHGWLTASSAIQKSCNCFFYEVGRLMKDRIFPYLTAYGFGQRTGVEIGEAAGIQQSPDYFTSLGQTWVPGDYLQLAIGQRGSYTPIQLAAYAMMIANKGVRYKTHLIGSVRSFDSTEDTVIQPEVAAKVTWSQEAMDAVQKGMIAVGKSGTAAAYFASAPFTVACKTGTAETGTSSAMGTFIAYAPVENPEVAIGVVMEYGTSAAAAQVARQILGAYFENKEKGESPTESNVLLP